MSVKVDQIYFFETDKNGQGWCVEVLQSEESHMLYDELQRVLREFDADVSYGLDIHVVLKEDS